MTPTIALAIPHCPWIPERVTSLQRLLDGLGSQEGHPTKVFDEKEPNWSWSLKIWNWGVESGCDWLLQLQDDVIPSPMLWGSLYAMLQANTDAEIIGLQGAHPKFRTLSRDGYRWARSRAWMVGVGWLIQKKALVELLTWRAGIPSDVLLKVNEDDLIARFAEHTERDVYHPIPTLIDHDISIPSSYQNDNHKHRKPTVTWHEFGEKELETVDFWKPTQDVPFVTNPHLNRCWFCESEPSAAGFEPTGAVIGRNCLSKAVQHLLMARTP